MKYTRTLTTLVLFVFVFASGCGGAPATPTQAPVDGPVTELPELPETPEAVVPTPKIITYALPRFALEDSNASAIVLRVVPPLTPPTDTADALLNNEEGIVIGGLLAMRDLPLSDSQVPLLPSGEYQVMVKQGYMIFIRV